MNAGTFAKMRQRRLSLFSGYSSKLWVMALRSELIKSGCGAELYKVPSGHSHKPAAFGLCFSVWTEPQRELTRERDRQRVSPNLSATDVNINIFALTYTHTHTHTDRERAREREREERERERKKERERKRERESSSFMFGFTSILSSPRSWQGLCYHTWDHNQCKIRQKANQKLKTINQTKGYGIRTQ